jgi:hypothetical protein
LRVRTAAPEGWDGVGLHPVVGEALAALSFAGTQLEPRKIRMHPTLIQGILLPGIFIRFKRH